MTSLLKKGAIVPTDVKPTDYFSPIFPRVNKDGTTRLLLNLKSLNDYVEHVHFKMEGFSSVLELLTPNCWLASVDLKSAYYSVPILGDHQKYLKFLWEDNAYVFVAMPNGYADGPRVFTKMLKPPFAELRGRGYPSVVFLDDSILKGNTFFDCLENVTETVKLLQSLGFTIHPDKSVLKPTQEIEFLGYLINTVTMMISLPLRKVEKIEADSRRLLDNPSTTVREVASLLGQYVATAEAVPYATLHYRALERDKNKAIKYHRGDFDKTMTLSEGALTDITWWLLNIRSQKRSILPIPIDVTIYSDASKTGWGATLNGITTSGYWLLQEWLDYDINALELIAARLAILSFYEKIKGVCVPAFANLASLPSRPTHIRLMLDNTTAVSYINRMGGTHSEACHNVSMLLWNWAEARNLWLSAAHIPGVDNTNAD